MKKNLQDFLEAMSTKALQAIVEADFSNPTDEMPAHIVMLVYAVYAVEKDVEAQSISFTTSEIQDHVEHIMTAATLMVLVRRGQIVINGTMRMLNDESTYSATPLGKKVANSYKNA